MAYYIRMKDERFFLRMMPNGEAETTEVLSGATAFSFEGGSQKGEELSAKGFTCHLTNQYGERVSKPNEIKFPSTAEQFTALPSAQRERLLQLYPKEINALFVAAEAPTPEPEPKPEAKEFFVYDYERKLFLTGALTKTEADEIARQK